MRVRLRDVAEAAGVSSATASMVLNGKDASIGQETRDRVFAAATELGYRPNVVARSLRSRRSHTIGFVSDEVVTTPYAGEMIEGAQEVANKHGYVMLLGNTGNDPVIERRTVDAMLDRQVDAVIYATMYHRIVVPPSGVGSVPLVLLDARVEEGADISWVAPDEAGGARIAVEHLIGFGHRRIAYIDDAKQPPAAIERGEAYRDVLAEHGLTVEDRLVAAGVSTAAGGIEAAERLLGQPDRPTAIFCFNDRMAAGAAIAARRLGLSIPEDLSIVGFDNQVLVAEAVDPGLSSVQLPHYEMGRWAMEQVLRLLDEEAGPHSQRMPCPLVERGSVAPPRQP